VQRPPPVSARHIHRSIRVSWLYQPTYVEEQAELPPTDLVDAVPLRTSEAGWALLDGQGWIPVQQQFSALCDRSGKRDARLPPFTTPLSPRATHHRLAQAQRPAWLYGHECVDPTCRAAPLLHGPHCLAGNGQLALGVHETQARSVCSARGVRLRVLRPIEPAPVDDGVRAIRRREAAVQKANQFVGNHSEAALDIYGQRHILLGATGLWHAVDIMRLLGYS